MIGATLHLSQSSEVGFHFYFVTIYFFIFFIKHLKSSIDLRLVSRSSRDCQHDV